MSMGSEIDKLISTHSASLCLFVQVGHPNGWVHQSKKRWWEWNGGGNKEANTKRWTRVLNPLPCFSFHSGKRGEEKRGEQRTNQTVDKITCILTTRKRKSLVMNPTKYRPLHPSWHPLRTETQWRKIVQNKLVTKWVTHPCVLWLLVAAHPLPLYKTKLI